MVFSNWSLTYRFKCFALELTVHPFHVEEKMQKSLSFCKCEKPSKQRKLSNLDKDCADVLAASDRGSYFEQEKLIALDEEEQSRWENKTASASRSN